MIIISDKTKTITAICLAVIIFFLLGFGLGVMNERRESQHEVQFYWPPQKWGGSTGNIIVNDQGRWMVNDSTGEFTGVSVVYYLNEITPGESKVIYYLDSGITLNITKPQSNKE